MHSVQKMKNKVSLFICWTLIVVSSVKISNDYLYHVRIDESDQLKNLLNETRYQRDELSVKLNQLQETYQQLVCKTVNQTGISETGGWCNKAVKSNHATDTGLVVPLAELFGNQTVVSLGDGPGHYRRLLVRSGVRKYDAYDGAPNIRNITNGEVNFLDLTLAQYWLPVYDWVMCLEVVEHISKQHEGTVVDNLVRAAGTGIVLSWAVPKQGGFHHVNPQLSQYVHDVMKQRRFIEDVVWTRKLRVSAKLYWFRNNVIVFKREFN